MKSKLKIDKPKVAVIGWNSSGGHELAELMSKRGKQGDVDYLGSTLVDPASTNLDAQINNVAKKHPDFIFLHCVETTTAVLLKSEQKFNLKIPVIGLAATGSASVYKSVKPETGQLFEYLLGFTPGNIDEAGTAQLVADAKTSGHADDADNPNFVQGYVTGQVMVEALKKAGPSPTRAGYIKALSSLQGFDTKGLSGPISFSATNNQGAALSRPTRYDYATGKLVAVGEYADFEDALTGEYSRGGS
jgi:branched-chain amino acid transport system substrate-binding protein